MKQKVKDRKETRREIQDRIEIINQGFVPKGYKQTTIGIIPEDWEVNKLGEILDFKNGINAKKEQYGKGFKFINVLDILNNKYITYENIIDRVDIDNNSFENNKVEYGDILFQRSSETVDEAATANVYLSEKPVTFGGFVIRGKKKGEYLPIYFNYMLKSSLYRKQVQQKAAGSTRYNIGQESLQEINYCSPSINEQQKIADVLSAWDQAIELKESLIKEKEEQKKGLMEKLQNSNGNRTWKEYKIGDLIEESKEVEQNPQVTNLITVRLHLGGVQERKLRGNETVGSTTLYKRRKGQFIYGKQNFHNGSLGIVPASLDGYASSSDIPSFDIDSNQVDILYLYYYWSQKKMYKRLSNYTTGTGSKRLNPKEFFNVSMKLPPLTEQKRIATILSTADREIELLNEELKQLKQQKKGLMQLLLTGIVRVKGDDDE